ncbi:MAG: DNA recombination protein RmuC [Propionibacteriaceae bacterium]|jgi:DNA recombination protein RmuC|nr:DNA recombination protein RmuC [Propionibacteriaceae bacterium]
MEIAGWIAAGLLAIGLVAVYWLLARPANARAARAEAEAAEARTQATANEVELRLSKDELLRAAELADAVRADLAQSREDAGQARVELARAVAEREAALQQFAELKDNRAELATQFKAISADVLKAQGEQAKAVADERLKATETVLAPVKENLDKLASKLSEVEKQRVEITTTLTEQVRTVKTTSDQLRRETSALATALRKPQTRGAWGELQLKNVVEAAGMAEHVDFFQQFASANAAETAVRPDLKVELGEGRFIFVDSKVPMGAFLDALEVEDEQARAAELKRVSKHLRAHIDALSAKEYFTAEDGTPEFVVLFVPHEAMVAEALSNDPKLHEYAFSKNIVLATPSSLIAMLKAVAYSWQQNALAENAAAIKALGDDLYRRIGVLGGHFAKLGKSLDTAVVAYNQAVGSLERNVIVQARRMHDYGIGDNASADKLARLEPVNTESRDLQKTELIAGETEDQLELES